MATTTDPKKLRMIARDALADIASQGGWRNGDLIREVLSEVISVDGGPAMDNDVVEMLLSVSTQGVDLKTHAGLTVFNFVLLMSIFSRSNHPEIRAGVENALEVMDKHGNLHRRWG